VPTDPQISVKSFYNRLSPIYGSAVPPLETLFGEDASVIREIDFQIVLLVAVVIPFGNGLLSPTLDSLVEPLGASPATIGWLISVFWAPGILIVPIAGLLADTYGRKRILVVSLLVYGIAGLAMAFTQSFTHALILRLLQGIGWAGLLPIVTTIIGDLYVPPRELTAQGLRVGVTGLTGAAVSLIAGALVVVSWQYPFLLFGLAIPVGLLVLLRFEEPTTLRSVADGETPNARTQRRDLFVLLRRPAVRTIIVARFFPDVVWVAFATYISIVVVRILGGSPVQAGAMFAAVSILIGGSASQAGRLSGWFPGRISLAVTAALGYTAGLLVVMLATSIEIAFVGTAVFGVSFGIAIATFVSLLTDLAPDSQRSSVVSIGATGGRLLGTLTPIAMGGVIASLTQTVGFANSVRVAGILVAAVGGGGGILLLLAARRVRQSTSP